jgi:hypothetical protein
MDFKKLLMGGIAGAVTTFLLGWLIFGMLLMDFMNSHTGVAGNISRAEPDYLYLILGNLAMGLLFAYLFIKANINSMGSGLINGGIIGALMSVGSNCIWYATSTAVSKTGMAADVAASIVMFAISGAVVAMVIGMGKKAA